MEKYCPRCKNSKPLSFWGRNKARSDGLNSYCRECCNELHSLRRKSRPPGEHYKRYRETSRKATRRYLIANPNYGREQKLKANYGITLDQYNQILAKQNNLCSICEKPNKHKRRLNVDHDHITGVVRGLLCHHCNTSLGGFGDSIEVLARAIKYLEEHKIHGTIN
jgi:hypothetical protein